MKTPSTVYCTHMSVLVLTIRTHTGTHIFVRQTYYARSGMEHNLRRRLPFSFFCINFEPRRQKRRQESIVNREREKTTTAETEWRINQLSQTKKGEGMRNFVNGSSAASLPTTYYYYERLEGVERICNVMHAFSQLVSKSARFFFLPFLSSVFGSTITTT